MLDVIQIHLSTREKNFAFFTYVIKFPLYYFIYERRTKYMKVQKIWTILSKPKRT